tara:strand:+ start:7424 stop:7663 length:240 start_codon:yes stop_codon:yes gene_type:complete
MKISKNRLVQIIKEELDDYNLSMAQDDPEEFLSSMQAKERIREIDLQIAELLKEKENLMMNIGSGQTTFGQSIDRSPNE